MDRSDLHPESFPSLEGVELLLLDLGGVIIDIDPDRSSKAFAELGQGSQLSDHSKAEQDELFDRFERGDLDAASFRKELRERASIDADDRKIDEAWNALLLGIPQARFHFLERMAHRYRLHLFSNTNELHMKGFSEIVDAAYGFDGFKALFEGIHLSYEMGARKPEARAFDLLLERMGASPEKVLFIDDTKAHTDAARQKGVRTYHLGEQELTELEEKLLP